MEYKDLHVVYKSPPFESVPYRYIIFTQHPLLKFSSSPLTWTLHLTSYFSKTSSCVYSFLHVYCISCYLSFKRPLNANYALRVISCDNKETTSLIYVVSLSEVATVKTMF
jgi:hypothetical protein